MAVVITGRQRRSPQEWIDDFVRSFRDRQAFAQLYGFPPMALPVVLLGGLGFLMLTLPALFVLIEREISYEPVQGILEQLRTLSLTWSRALTTGWADSVDERLTSAALLAVVAVIAAAALRSIIAWTVRPVAVAAVGLIGGLLGLPTVALAAQVIHSGVRVIAGFAGMITAFLRWVSPALAVFVLVALAAAAVVGIVLLFKLIRDEDLWLFAMGCSVAVVAMVGIVAAGWLDGVGRWIGSLSATIDEWISKYVAPVIGWTATGLIVLSIVLVVIGALTATLGQIGRTVILPVVAATKAGRDQGKCTDLTVGSGLVLSLVLCAAVADRAFGRWFAQVWESTPLLGSIPSPVHIYDVLLTNSAEAFLAPAFRGYVPFVDAALLLLTAGVGVLSLLLSGRRWEVSEGGRVASPVLIATGLAIAGLLPLLLITLFVRADMDS